MSTDLEDLMEMVYQAEQAEFTYALANVLRHSAMRKMEYIRSVPMEERTVAMLEDLAHYTRQVREQERVMNDAIRRVQALEARATIDMEKGDDDDTE